VSGALLAFDRVSYRYPRADAPALDELSLELHPGEFCVLAGLSGSGKSTLLRAACGLVPHFHGGHFSGRVTVAGLDTREHGPARIGLFAGALFQDPETQLVSNSVRAELSLALESRGESAVAVARGVEEVALALGIDALLDRSTHELSGGEQQRVALGAALAGRPRIVLLDEPTSQLDPVAGDELIGLLRRLNQEWETTVLLCEHRLERCLAAADRVIALTRGRLACDGSPAEFLRWAAREAPALQTPGARLFSLARIPASPVLVKQARAALRARALLPSAGSPEMGLQAAQHALDEPSAPRDRAVGPRGGNRADSLDPDEPSARRDRAVGPRGGVGADSVDGGRPDSLGRGAARARVRTGTRARSGPVEDDSGRARDDALAAGADRALDGRRIRRARRSRRETGELALSMRGVWHELRSGPAVLRGINLDVAAGERVALMGRNGAGKSTLLRHAAGLLDASRGRIERAGRVALLLQNPGDYLIHERVGEEVPGDVLRATGLADLADRHPRDLSGGERQRLALAIVAGARGAAESGGAEEQAVVLALDEPTRGMDREAKAELAAELRARAESRQAVIVATHDPEFAASFAARAILLADGRIVADGRAEELLAGGWYFATETARILGGAGGEQGAALLDARARELAGPHDRADGPPHAIGAPA
jgi:energy-coupling factor transporter ATP-binding protein EcfA2